MDWLTFFSNAISSLAWPVSVVVLVLLFRKPITERLPFLKKMKYKDLELEFEKELEQLQAEVRPKLGGRPAPQLEAPKKDELAGLVSASPRLAILAAYREVERTLEDTALHLGARADITAPAALRYLHEKNAIDEASMKVVLRLQALRDKVVHATDFEPDEATGLDYAATARAVIRYLSQQTAPK